jgi:hypothetical protein
MMSHWNYFHVVYKSSYMVFVQGAPSFDLDLTRAESYFLVDYQPNSLVYKSKYLSCISSVVAPIASVL